MPLEHDEELAAGQQIDPPENGSSATRALATPRMIPCPRKITRLASPTSPSGGSDARPDARHGSVARTWQRPIRGKLRAAHAPSVDRVERPRSGSSPQDGHHGRGVPRTTSRRSCPARGADARYDGSGRARLLEGDGPVGAAGSRQRAHTGVVDRATRWSWRYAHPRLGRWREAGEAFLVADASRPGERVPACSGRLVLRPARLAAIEPNRSHGRYHADPDQGPAAARTRGPSA